MMKNVTTCGLTMHCKDFIRNSTNSEETVHLFCL